MSPRADRLSAGKPSGSGAARAEGVDPGLEGGQECVKDFPLETEEAVA